MIFDNGLLYSWLLYVTFSTSCEGSTRTKKHHSLDTNRHHPYLLIVSSWQLNFMQ